MPSLNILVHPVAEYGSVMWWFMQAEEMERVHYFVNSTNSQEQFPTWDAMVLCWAELLHWYNGKFPWWSPSLSDNCTAMIKFPPSENEIPSIIRGWEFPSLATAAMEFLYPHKILWYHILRHLSIEPWYTLEYLYQSAIHTSWGKWFDSGEHPLYPQGNCKFGRNQLHCWILTLGMPSHLTCNYHSNF